MHIHILGICGSFMGSLAVLARQLGHTVSGSDANVYPPMSTQLQEQGIVLDEGYHAAHLKPHPDLVVIGNTLSRGNPAVEYVLNSGIDYYSGPQWLARWILKDKWVLGVAGTHGKTTTSAMLTWILEYAGMKPGYLIGGVTNNFQCSADKGDSAFFVVEADEYDSAFFDKRSKFVHYAPRTTILNNLEFDHADIFASLEDIQRQFHHLVRTIPGNGLILSPIGDAHIEEVLHGGCWTPRQQFGIGIAEERCKQIVADGGTFWNGTLLSPDGGEFEVARYGDATMGNMISRGTVRWEQTGRHNVSNGLAAIAAAHHAGVELATACSALEEFQGVKRRLELRGEVGGVTVYDDFAHHPTAIAATLEGMQAKLGNNSAPSRLIAVIEPRSNTMKMGVHQSQLAESCTVADMTLWFKPDETGLDLDRVVADSKVPGEIFNEVDGIVDYLKVNSRAGDHIVIMSNGGFGGIHSKLLNELGSN
ncbi:MAG: UDP-N-acetylmuramate:L-alanyl-gamma-D-glutamyl-meso-diaminopimelate ligase [Gammaproteobacteria bacterium]|jgi:UDP-N-acetylmuramate: L-alanyl-gamma-D-glutamyl-meso-diaminopimelate ligase|nr:UDP-N-acetylmuramate:L-alanyl-gamma-D-glutamyl-meso-diaminopimelate ligase [Gammaproteobacteria bacterium]HJO10842.1 UDP-N-acetylmuramate:L-alanyl-gamma-D-glutamyl-meso-diaminopimelate ligase [Gammaproteobacteria bacterium]|tara:strand:- start:2277 stop:3707 length:1431 start_codon:yes stop_codon:yes gene_type:complete